MSGSTATAVDRIRRRLRRLGRHLFYGWQKCRPHETAILEAVHSALPDGDRRALKAQLHALEFVQRSSAGRMVMFSLDPDEAALPLFTKREGEDCLARVRLRADGRRHTILLMTWQGRLSTLEFKRPPDALRSGSYEILDVALHVPDKGIAAALTRLEHGRMDDEGE